MNVLITVAHSHILPLFHPFLVTFSHSTVHPCLVTSSLSSTPYWMAFAPSSSNPYLVRFCPSSIPYLVESYRKISLYPHPPNWSHSTPPHPLCPIFPLFQCLVRSSTSLVTFSPFSPSPPIWSHPAPPTQTWSHSRSSSTT